ncbi:hypothetical protein BM1_01085 [Bipolaris maydis]|nr:hypothetical protein BM1_01085 [Bipolaris maydis]
MRSSLAILLSTLCAAAYSVDIQNSFQCQNGAIPSVSCASPSDVPDCSCTCTNGITFNQALSIPGSGPGASPECQSEKEACLLREQELATNLVREQETVAHLSEQTRSCNAREETLTNQLNAANAELVIKQQQQAKYDAMLAEENKRRARAFRYQGCYVESKSRVIHEKSTIDSSMTVQKCSAICKDYLYYALGYAKECWCGDTFHVPAELVSHNQCSVPCVGNSAQKCGGNWKISIYSK